MENSKIEWTDHTFNPWWGCVKVSPGCANCYANSLDKRIGGDHWGKGKPRKKASSATLRLPALWNAQAEHDMFKQCVDCGNRESWAKRGFQACSKCGGKESFRVRPRVFCASMGDVLDDEVPAEWFAELLSTIRKTPNLDWQLLTKRPENFMQRMTDAMKFNEDKGGAIEDHVWMNHWACAGRSEQYVPQNVWFGASVENQDAANSRILHLLSIPAKIRFLSCEPLLGPVDLEKIPAMNKNAPCSTNALTGVTSWPHNDSDEGPKIHWVIAGGESGGGARTMNAGWARSLRDQCAEAGVSFFFKQWGEYNEEEKRLGKKLTGSLLDGVAHKQFPA